MDVPDILEPLRYLAHADVKVYEKYLRSRGVSQWREWLRYSFSLMPMFCVSSVVAYQIGVMPTVATTPTGVIATIVFGCFSGAIWALQQYEISIKQSAAQQRGKSWDCVLTDEFYQFTDPEGVTTSIPWRLMKIEAAEPEYWDISCRSLELSVYREPLRKAGLEEEFERRIGQDGRVTSQA